MSNERKAAHPAAHFPSIRRPAIAIGLFAFALRAAILAGSWQHGAWNVTPDSERYLALGRSLHGGLGFQLPLAAETWAPEYLTLPTYPLLLAALRVSGPDSALPVLLMQGALTALVAVLAFTMASRLAGPKAGAAAGLLASLDPQAVAYSNLVLTDALSMVLVSIAVTTALLMIERPSAATAAATGLAFGIAAFVRPSNMVLFAVAAAAVVATSWQARRPRLLLLLPLTLALALLPVLAWSARNHARTGQWFYTTSPDVVLVRWQLPRLLAEAEGVSLDEARDSIAETLGDRELYRTLGVKAPAFRARAQALARELVARHPTAFARMYLAGVVRVAAQPDAAICLVRGRPVEQAGLSAGGIGVADAFRQRWAALGWESRGLYFGQLVYLAGLWLLAAAGVWTAVRPARRPAAVLTLALGITAIVLASGGFPGDPRYRLAAMPLLIVLAAIGADRVVSTWGRRSARRASSARPRP